MGHIWLCSGNTPGPNLRNHCQPALGNYMWCQEGRSHARQTHSLSFALSLGRQIFRKLLIVDKIYEYIYRLQNGNLNHESKMLTGFPEMYFGFCFCFRFGSFCNFQRSNLKKNMKINDRLQNLILPPPPTILKKNTFGCWSYKTTGRALALVSYPIAPVIPESRPGF